ncbi:MAG: protein kinase [Pirellulaceae bacterium]
MRELLQRGRQLYEETRAQSKDETGELSDASMDSTASANRISFNPDNFSFLDPPIDDTELGRLGEYRVLRLLGQGGMGMVFLAEDLALGRQVALKVMSPVIAGNVAARKRFLREARVMAAVISDHIVAIYQVGEHSQIPFLVMPLLQGESLSDRLKRQGKLPLTEVIRVATEAAWGLAAAHERGLVHRDIKPDNIWLEAPNGRVKILDFGLARGEEDTGLTHSGTVLGTPRYMSPEQTEGGSIDHRTDLFSLGSVLYHTATGQAPFQGTSLASTLVAVARANPRPITSLREDLPASVARLITSLLKRNPDERPQTAQQVAEQFAAQQQFPEPHLKFAPKPTTEATKGQSTSTLSPHKSSTSLFSHYRSIVGVAIGLLFLFAVAGVIIQWKTKAGTVFVTIDAAVDPIPVYVKQESLEIADPNDGKTVRITVDESNRQMQLQKEGFVAVVSTFDLTSQDGRNISVRFEPSPRPTDPASSTQENVTSSSDASTNVAANERRIAEWVLAHGGSVQVQYGNDWHDAGITSQKELPDMDFLVSRVVLSDVEDESELEILAGLSREIEIWLPNTNVLGHCFEYFNSISKLECINLQGCRNLDPAYVHQLTQARNLKRLMLLGSNLGNEIADLAVKVPSLSYIEFGNRLTSEGLKVLAGCKNVRGVGLRGCRLLMPSDFVLLCEIPNLQAVTIDTAQAGTDVFESLSQVPGLKTLGIHKVDNTHEFDVRGIASLSSVEELDLSHNALTLAACEPLRQLPSLRRLRIRATGLPQSDIVRLGMILPKCRIDHDGGELLSSEDRRIGQQQVLAWLISLGGTANAVLPSGETVTVDANTGIPAADVCVQGIAIHDASDADLRQLEGLPAIGTVNLQGAPLTGSGFKSFASTSRVVDLEGLFLDGCENLQDQFTELLLDTPNLIYLHCQETPLGDALVDVALQLPQLGSLGLGENVSADGLSRLATHATVGWLFLSELSRFEPHELEPLQSMRNLHFLSVGVDQIDRDSLAILGAIPTLKTLRVSRLLNHVADLILLRNIEELELNYQGSQPLDTSSLGKMSWLKKLSFYNNANISQADIDALRYALPSCEISWREGTVPPTANEN